MAAYCQSQLHAVEYCNERATVQIAVLGFAVPECVKGFFPGDRDAHTAVSKKLSTAGRLLAGERHTNVCVEKFSPHNSTKLPPPKRRIRSESRKRKHEKHAKKFRRFRWLLPGAFSLTNHLRYHQRVASTAVRRRSPRSEKVNASQRRRNPCSGWWVGT